MRHLPDAALRMRSRLIAAGDERYLRSGKDGAVAHVAIPAVSRRPSLTSPVTRARTGSVWGLLSTVVVVVSLIAAGYFSWELWGTDMYTAYRQRQMSGQLAAIAAASPTTSATADLPPAAAKKKAPKPVPITSMDAVATDGSPVGRISIPKIGLDAVFVMGTDVPQLRLGPGLWKWGVMPGDVGNATISGHRTTYSHPYRHLDELSAGDKITVSIPGRADTIFEVRGSTIASPFDVAVTGQTAGVRLTLTTCNPVGSARQRLVIEAEAISGPNAQYAVAKDAWQLAR